MEEAKALAAQQSAYLAGTLRGIGLVEDRALVCGGEAVPAQPKKNPAEDGSRGFPR